MALFPRRSALVEAARTVREALAAGGAENELAALLRDLRAALGAPPGAGTAVSAQEVLDALLEPAFLLAAGGRIAASNAGLEQLLGAGRSLGRTILEATRSAELAGLGAAAVAGARAAREVLLPSLQRTVLASVAPLGTGEALVVLRDLTDHKRAESARRDFVANASHELRTPVSAIAGAAETLLSGVSLGPDARTFVEIISRHSLRLSRLAQDLLDLSRLESGEFSLDLAPLEILPRLAEAVELVAARAAEKGVALAVAAPAGLAATADRRALEQILVNLLDNAIKFTPAQGQVAVRAEATASGVVISVADTGSGIEERHRGRLFERFYRVDDGRSRASGGTGLGLSIVKHLAQAQGGEVGVESGAHGSRFWVRLRPAS